MAAAMMIAFIFAMEYFVKRHMDRIRTLQQQRRVADGKIILKKYYNTGTAGNFLDSRPEDARRIHIAALSSVFMLLFYFMPKKNASAVKTGLAFLAGGGLSNLYDRLSKGYVIDYVSFGFGPKQFQKLVFNISDFFIFAGAVLCMLHIFLSANEKV